MQSKWVSAGSASFLHSHTSLHVQVLFGNTITGAGNLLRKLIFTRFPEQFNRLKGFGKFRTCPSFWMLVKVESELWIFWCSPFSLPVLMSEKRNIPKNLKATIFSLPQTTSSLFSFENCNVSLIKTPTQPCVNTYIHTLIACFRSVKLADSRLRYISTFFDNCWHDTWCRCIGYKEKLFNKFCPIVYSGQYTVLPSHSESSDADWEIRVALEMNAPYIWHMTRKVQRQKEEIIDRNLFFIFPVKNQP